MAKLGGHYLYHKRRRLDDVLDANVLYNIRPNNCLCCTMPMIETIYIEENLLDHPRARAICERFSNAQIICCRRYGEVFNPKAQNFRLQKQKPALILAEKYKNFVLPTPPGYGIGAKNNYYFSHMLNCLYDCRYCFLQGMYNSAHYVLFVNYESFFQEIQRICIAHGDEPVHFFSGYDCDSLALEPITGFSAYFLPLFAQMPNAFLELRTKSTQIRTLLRHEPMPNCVVAFSLNPEIVAEKLEHGAPPLRRRIDAILKLLNEGWPIGLRFDPIVYFSDYQTEYKDFFAQVFAKIDPRRLHSVSLGTFRLPDSFFKKLRHLYPEEKLFAGPLQESNGMTGYKFELEREIMHFCADQLAGYLPTDRIFPCAP